MLALASVLGCAEPTIPDRAGTYSFADTSFSFLPPDTIIDVFRWPASRLPVRFWADPRGNMGVLVTRAAGAWEGQLLYSEFQGSVVSDSLDADVIVQWQDSVPPDVPPDTTPAPTSCGGFTSFDYDSTGSALAGPVHVSLNVLVGGAPASAGHVQDCMRRTVIHEVGHALGLLRHSPSATDIMYPQPLVSFPSRADRWTIETLYHTRPTIAPPP